MNQEFLKTKEENGAIFKKINRNFDLKEICGSDHGTFDSQASVRDSGTSEKIKNFSNFIEMQQYLLKKPFEKIDESENRSKKRQVEAENDTANKLKNINLIMGKNTTKLEEEIDKQAQAFEHKIFELEQALKNTIGAVDTQVQKHKEELQSNDTILNEMEGEIKGLGEQIQTNQNEIKNTNLRFQTQIESLNGEM